MGNICSSFTCKQVELQMEGGVLVRVHLIFRLGYSLLRSYIFPRRNETCPTASKRNAVRQSCIQSRDPVPVLCVVSWGVRNTSSLIYSPLSIHSASPALKPLWMWTPAAALDPSASHTHINTLLAMQRTKQDRPENSYLIRRIDGKTFISFILLLLLLFFILRWKSRDRSVSLSR